MPNLNNNQVAAVVRDALKQSTGAEGLDTLDLQGIIDTANDQTIVGSQEQFTKALINVLYGYMYTDTSYRSSYEDPFYHTAEEYGALLQTVSMELPTAKESHAWKDFVSGTSTAGEYTIYLPVISTQLYGKTVSWEIPIAITGEQWDTAFRSASELSRFVNYVLMVLDNAIVCHLKDMDRMNRNNFMAEKIAYSADSAAKGVHKLNMVEEWAHHINASESITVEDIRNNKEALNWIAMEFKKYIDYFGEMSTVFNTAQKERFTPSDRIVFQVLSDFERDVMAVAQSDTYHNEIVSLPGHQTVPFWQGSGEAFSFADVSAIDVEIASDGTAISQSGIIGFLCDKWGVIHNTVSRRVAAKVFEPEDLVQYYHQFRDGYFNNLTMNAIVFTLEDWTYSG